MTDQGFLDQAERARPAVTAEDAAVILDGVFGVRGRIVELGSQQDRNFRVETEDGRRFVLKVCHADYGFQALDAQNAAMRHIGGRAGAPAVPTPLLSVDGRDIVELDIRGELCLLRLLTYLDGQPLTRRVHLGEETIAALGKMAAELSLALADFSHPGLDRACSGICAAPARWPCIFCLPCRIRSASAGWPIRWWRPCGGCSR